MQKHGNLYNFLITLLENKSLQNVKLLQIRFLEYLMNGFKVYKKFNKLDKELDYKAEDLYLFLLANSKRTVNNVFLNTPTDKHNKEIYLQVQILFNLRETFFEKLVKKGIINNDFDQSDVARQKYEERIAEKTKSQPELKPKFGELIAERTKLRKQRFHEIANKEKMVDNNLFKEYFEYSSPSGVYKNLNTRTGIEKNKTELNKIQDKLADLMVNIENNPTNNVEKIRNRKNMVEIVNLIEFNKLNQLGKKLKILTPNHMLSRLPISLAHLKAGNNFVRHCISSKRLICFYYTQLLIKRKFS